MAEAERHRVNGAAENDWKVVLALSVVSLAGALASVLVAMLAHFAYDFVQFVRVWPTS